MNFQYTQISYSPDRLYELVAKHVADNKGSFVGRLGADIQQVIFNELGLPFDQTSNILLGIFRKGHNIEIHSDNHNGNIHRAITIPIRNCQDTYMNWYQVMDESKIYKEGYQGRYAPVAKIPNEHALLVDSVCCDKPFIANINQWHSGECRGEGTAVMLSVRYWPFSGQPLIG
jgi:ribosome-associated toxin RatA of RatAB toxin-antitoxin module